MEKPRRAGRHRRGRGLGIKQLVYGDQHSETTTSEFAAPAAPRPGGYGD